MIIKPSFWWRSITPLNSSIAEIRSSFSLLLRFGDVSFWVKICRIFANGFNNIRNSFKNGASFNTAWGAAAANAGRYSSNVNAPYFIKTKANVCYKSQYHKNSHKLVCI